MISFSHSGYVFFLLLYINFSHVVFSQQGLETPESDTSIVIKSQVLKHDQSILVRLPKSYRNSSASYPIVFYFDAQDNTLSTFIAATVDRLMWTKDVPNLILVGIPHRNRGADLSIEKSDSTSALFLEFIASELVPYIDQNYRTIGMRTFIGHSLGGQFATFGMATKPAIFQNVIAISPAMMYPASEKWFKHKTYKAMAEFLKADVPFHTHYYACVGDKGFQETQFYGGVLRLDSLFKNSTNKKVYQRFDYIQGFNHGNTPLAGIAAGLNHIFQYWQFPEDIMYQMVINKKGDAFQELQKQHRQIKAHYGEAIPLPKFVYWQLGKYCLESNQLAEAQKIIQMNIDLDPKSAVPYGVMGDIMVAQNNKSEAIRYYQEAITRLEPTDNSTRQSFETKIQQQRIKP